MPSITGMDEKLSDFVGSTSFKMSDNFIKVRFCFGSKLF